MHFPMFCAVITELIAVLQLFEGLFERSISPEELYQRPHRSVAERASLLIADDSGFVPLEACWANAPKLCFLAGLFTGRARTVNRTVNC
jgi:hypothetical protein